uniref:Uncharacterized protein n=1 Tax=viral metagenome TaxID=1070528 RepID=A0A6C0BMZ0_9ZZZZ
MSEEKFDAQAMYKVANLARKHSHTRDIEAFLEEHVPKIKAAARAGKFFYEIVGSASKPVCDHMKNLGFGVFHSHPESVVKFTEFRW